MLKLANHVGKGWFAIELGEKIDFLIKIPKYILNAIAFACQEIVDLSIYKKFYSIQSTCTRKLQNCQLYQLV